MVEIICTVIAAIATVVASAAGARTARYVKRSETRAARRAHESRLAMELMYANCALSLVTAKKLNGHQTNGDVEEAMEAANKARDNYMSFVRDEAAKNFSKV